jgi:hypothetical protein
MITIVWYDLAPSQVTPSAKQAYVAAVQRVAPGDAADGVLQVEL